MLPGYRLAVTFQDGLPGVVDLSGLTSAPELEVFEPLRDQAYFSQARLELGAVTWPNGADLDPAWMHDQSRKQKRGLSTFSPETEFRTVVCPEFPGFPQLRDCALRHSADKRSKSFTRSSR